MHLPLGYYMFLMRYMNFLDKTPRIIESAGRFHCLHLNSLRKLSLAFFLFAHITKVVGYGFTDVSGIILDRKTDTPIPFASVKIAQLPMDEVKTDSTGEFIMPTRWQTGSLLITAVGYYKTTFTFDSTTDGDVVIYLDALPIPKNKVRARMRKSNSF